MKKIFPFLLAGLDFAFSQAQNRPCNNEFFPTTPGKKMEMTHYDKTSKPVMVVKNQLEKVNTNAQETEIIFKSESYNPKGKLMYKADQKIVCKNGTVYLDARNWSGPSMMQQNIPNIKTVLSGEGVAYPSSLAVGQKLPDADLEIQSILEGSSMPIASFKIKITDRKVEGKQTVQTPAGTFECFKIIYKGDIKAGFVNQNINYVEYIAKNVGVVKLEAFGKDGTLESYHMLTKLE